MSPPWRNVPSVTHHILKNGFEGPWMVYFRKSSSWCLHLTIFCLFLSKKGDQETWKESWEFWHVPSVTEKICWNFTIFHPWNLEYPPEWWGKGMESEETSWKLIISTLIHVLQKYHCTKCIFSCSQKKKHAFLAPNVPSVTHMSVLYEILQVAMNIFTHYRFP